MSTADLRLDLHKMIESINDNGTLTAVYAFLSGSKELPKSNWANTVTKKEEDAILMGLKQEAEGNVKTHDEVLVKLRKQFPHLKL